MGDITVHVSGLETDNKEGMVEIEVQNETLGFLCSPWLTRFIPSVHTVVFVLSLPFNVAAVFTFLFQIQVKTPAAVFMLNLAVSDVLFTILLPFNIVYRFSGNNWVIGEAMCRFVTAEFYCNMYCSILLMTCISVDRFLTVVYPFECLRWRTVGRAWQVCLVIWMVAIAGTAPLLMSKLTIPIKELNITTCYDLLDESAIKRYLFPYFISFISAFFFLPLVITVCCYIVTIRNLSSPTTETLYKKSRSIFLCMTVLCVFIICFGPSNVIFLMYYLYVTTHLENPLYFAYILSVSIGSISCCLDPVIYYFGSSKCKTVANSLMCCGNTKDDQRKTCSSSKSAGCSFYT